ncbi:unnamed protein product [Aureobasidium vineae]|uniref:Uncharacterized protein n=1 Tax=Aureobasidium vineae TaxID=2773715 RepID=A0A9N8JWP1_9PEZI|nr:unnamed protein product [Aureobasidium vineae]
MGFLERSRSLRRKETPFMRKKLDETTTSQEAKDANVEREAQRPIKSAHGYKDSAMKGTQTPSEALSRPRTASKVPILEKHPEVPMPNSARNFARRMSMTPSPRSTTTKLTLHANHSTPGVAFESRPSNPKRSMTTPIEPLPTLARKEEKSVEVVVPLAPPKAEAPSAAPRKEPHLRKSKSGTWRSFFLRKQSKPPLPDFNPADVAPPPALPKPSIKSFMPASSAKEGKKLHRNSISVDKTRGNQTGTRQQFTKSMGDRSALPQLKVANLSTLEPPPRSTARSPSAESAMSQYFDAASYNSGPSLPVTPLGGPNRLNVNIPAVEMERYSVMFEKLLQPQTSIMDRRQTMVKQLNLSDQPSGRSPTLQRRATSPNLSCRTPMAAEMNGDGSQVATPVPVYRDSNTPRLLRSQTAPPGALTTSREHQNQAPSTTNNSSACSTSSHMWSDASRPQTPASDAESFVSFDVNDDDDDSGDDDDELDDTGVYIHDAVAMQATPLFKDTHWRNDTPIMSCAPPIPPKALGRQSPPVFELEQQAASLDRPHPPRTSSLDDVAAKRQTHIGPQIGIARKISVVRRAPAPSRLSVPSPAQVKSPAALDPTTPMPVFSKQPLRPKLVDVRNRKSTLVVLDEASPRGF